MEKHLNQSVSYAMPRQQVMTDSLMSSEGSAGRLEDDIIAISLRIIIDLQTKLPDHMRPALNPKQAPPTGVTSG